MAGFFPISRRLSHVPKTPTTKYVPSCSINQGKNANADVVAVGAYGTNDEILFSIPGAGVKTITLGSELDLSETVRIKGFSQPGSAANTNAFGQPINAVLRIEITGAVGVMNATGIQIDADNCKIDGLVINGFSASGIYVRGTGATITGCFIGTNATGNSAGANGYGIYISADLAQIGGNQPANRNLISGNSLNGVFDFCGFGQNAVIAGNYIGTDLSGAVAVANKIGIRIEGTGLTLIGGTTVGAGNVISGNATDGVLLDARPDIEGNLVEPPKNNRIEGNLIGVDATGSIRVGNGGSGVHIQSGSGIPSAEWARPETSFRETHMVFILNICPPPRRAQPPQARMGTLWRAIGSAPTPLEREKLATVPAW